MHAQLVRQAASFVLLGLVCPATVWYGGLSVTPPMIGGLSVPALLGGCRSVCLSVTHNCLGSRLRFQTWDFHAYAISKSCMPAGSPAFTTCPCRVTSSSWQRFLRKKIPLSTCTSTSREATFKVQDDGTKRYIFIQFALSTTHIFFLCHKFRGPRHKFVQK